MNTCSVDGCLNRIEAKGFCNKHYLKNWRYGNPTAGKEFAPRGSGTTSKSNGYRLVTVGNNQILEHVAIAQRAIGKKMPSGAQVHHINGIKTDNRNDNLVVCPGEAYHKLIHRRQAAMNATGNPNSRKCRYCDQWDIPENMYLRPGKNTGYHRACRQITRRANQSK